MTDKQRNNDQARRRQRRIPNFPFEALSEQWLREHPPKKRRQQ